MNTAVLIAQILLQYGPAVAAEFQKLFSNPNPTQADWDNVWALCAKPFSAYVPAPPALVSVGA